MRYENRGRKHVENLMWRLLAESSGLCNGGQGTVARFEDVLVDRREGFLREKRGTEDRCAVGRTLSSRLIRGQVAPCEASPLCPLSQNESASESAGDVVCE